MNTLVMTSNALGFVFARASHWVDGVATSISEARAKRAVYTRTLNELSAMSDRDLADLGIARCDARSIAREAAYGPQRQ